MNGVEAADRLETVLLARSTGRQPHALAKAVFGSVSSRNLALVESAIAVMRRRKAVLGDAYPFGDGDNIVVPVEDEFGWYVTLLALSQVSRSGFERGNELLDVIGERAVPVLLGGDCQVVSFAYPVRATGDPRPEGFSEAVVWLGRKLGLRVTNGYRPPKRKDGGVDLVVSRRLSGSPLAAPMMLVQTTLSGDVRQKSRDIDVQLWRTWLDLSPATLVGLLVPFELTTDELDEAHGSGVVVLDRLRVCELLAGAPCNLPGHLRSWLESEWAGQKAAVTGAE